ncbi:MAG: hypothetical protein JST00_15565 [Deltaproteobacteria bacterium]|nr:hypothetical protein [Deltaproteobacteria bacterium]
MTFRLEALEAKYGDALLLHFGTAAKPRLVVIDGGPKGVYGASLKPRLAELRKAKKKLSVDLLMVSHLDDDHVAGVVDLLDEMNEAKDANEAPALDIADIWINTFQDKLGSDGLAKVAAWVAANAPKKKAEVFAASVAQGRSVRDLAGQLGITVNSDKGLVKAPKAGKKVVKLGPLSLTILCPSEVRIESLRKDWTKHLPKKGKANAAEIAQAAAYIDKSIYNLSSIVVLAQQGTKKMLLTGDARGDDILLGLEGAGLMKGGRFDCDVLKLPHHGSDRNVSTEFFQKVRAKHYVISANGRFGNPDTPTLEMITSARAGEKFTLWLTNRDGEKGVKARLDKFFAREKKKSYRVVYRDPSELGMTITP